MSVIEKVIRDLKTSCYTAIFEFSDEEKPKMDEVKEMLKSESDYLDIVLDKDDLKELTMNIDRIDEYEFRWHHIHQNLCDIIIKRFGLENTVLFDYDSLVDTLNDLVKKLGKNGFRIHIFLDEVTRQSEQVAINNLINTGKLNIMGYTSGELKTYVDSNNEPINNTIFIRSQAKIYELRSKSKLGEREKEND